MDLPAHVRILVETPKPTALTPIDVRLRRERPEVRYVPSVRLPEGIVARGHVLAYLTLADLEAIVSGYAPLRPTSLVIEPQSRPYLGGGLHFHARAMDGAAIVGTIRMRPETTTTTPPAIVVDVVLRANDDDEDATDHRADGPPPAAVLGAVLAELRDLRHRLRTSPMTDRQVVDHLQAILAVAHELEDDRPGRAPRASSREGTRAIARRVAWRFAQVALRDGIEPSVEEAIVRCADGGTIAAWEVHRALLSRGYRTDDVTFLESWWPGQVVFEATRAGRPVVRGTVLIDARFDPRRIETYATLRIDEAFDPNAYPTAEASLST
jgi:hypothetical protein